MKTHHFNGEYWYEKSGGVLERVKKWFWWQPYKNDTPLSLFGHRITFQYFGVDVSLGTTYFCLIYRERPDDPKKLLRIYLSPDSTPQSATDWYYGAPLSVQRMAKKRQTPARAAEGKTEDEPYQPETEAA